MVRKILLFKDNLDAAYNFISWKERISFLLDEFGLKAYIDNVVAIPMNADQLKEYRKELAREK